MSLLLLLSPAFSGVQGASVPAQSSFVAPLTAAPNVSTTAGGEAFFWLAPNQTALNYVLVVSNITNAFMAHIHLAPSGNIMVWLAPAPNTQSSEEAACIGVLSGGLVSLCATLMSGSFSGVYGQGIITASSLSGKACDGCNNVTFSQLMTDITAGNAYVNIHTTQNPGGEVQGTIVPSTATYIAPLSAASGVTTSATGEAFFWESANASALQYMLIVNDITNSFMAHIHLAPSGDIITWLAPNPNRAATGEESGCVAVLSGGPISGCSSYNPGAYSGILGQGTITAADLTGTKTCAACDNVTFSQLMTDINGGNAYVNIHTTQKPAGEVQGTIVPLAGATTPVPEFGTAAAVAVLFVAVAAVAGASRLGLSGRLRPTPGGP